MDSNLQNIRAERHMKAREAMNLLDPATTVYDKNAAAKVDALYAEIDLLDSQIRQMERFNAHLDGGLPSARSGNYGDDDLNPNRRQHRAFIKALRFGPARLSQSEADLISLIDATGRRIQNVAEGAGSAGGFLVPAKIMSALLIQLRYFGGVREVATIIETTGGAPMSWGVLDDTTNSGELIAENVTASSGDLGFSNVNLPVYKFSSKILPVSIELLQDSSVDIEPILLDTLAIRIGRAMNTFFTIGNGTAQPLGIVNAASSGVVLPTGNTTTITADGLTSLYHAVDLAYRKNDGCAWMMHDLTFKAIKTLKDADARPLWLPLSDGAFAADSKFGELFGKKLVLNNDMQPVGVDHKPVLFGDLSKFIIRDVTGAMIMRFTDSAYAKFGQVGFLGLARSGGALVGATNGSVLYLQNSHT